ncbi:unnamed protein product [Heterobilharzia americana]|nr:unnamed protein product [Heterobilharzia americana]
MNSLVQLTGKVDCMLDRMNKMEYKLTNVETGYMFNRSRTYGGPTVDSNRRNMDLGDFCGTDSVVERKILPNVTGEQNLLSMKTADSVSVTPVSSTLNTFSGTQFTSTTGTTTSASFLTTKTLNSCSVTCAERHVFGDANHGTSESFCSKPKYFTSTKLNIQENNPTSCKNAAEKIQSYTAKTAAQDSLDDQPIKIAPIIVSPLPDSHNFNENCRDISSRRETSDLVQLKYVDPLKTKNQFCDSRVTSTSLVDLDLKSEIKSPSVVRSNNSALAYYPCPNSTDYSVSNESSDPVDYKVTPSSSSSFSLSRKPDKTKSSATEKAQNSYRAQVERITNMLAETQNLLQERSSSKLNELAIENSDNIIDYNNGNNSNAVALKA